MCLFYTALSPAYLYRHLFAMLPDNWIVRLLVLLAVLTDYCGVISIGCLSLSIAKSHLEMILQNGTTLEMMKHFRRKTIFRKGMLQLTSQRAVLTSDASTISDSSSPSRASCSSGRV
jgi:hypothetical protein